MTPARSHLARGPFVTLEGPEGAGKTTQAARLRDALEAAGLSVVLLREPGGTALGEAIRSLLLEENAAGSVPISARADALLFNAARAQLVTEQIRPALERGDVVICSRYVDSTLAYQGAGMGVPVNELHALAALATDGLRPDLTLLIDVQPEVGLARKRGVEVTRFESSFDLPFHRRVRDAFLALAADEPNRFAIIDGGQPPDEVSGAIRAAFDDRLGQLLWPTGGGPGAATGDRGRVRRSEPNGRPVRITP